MLDGTTVSEFVADNFLYVLLAWAALAIYANRFGRSATRKRTATLIQAVSIFLLLASSTLILELGGTDIYLIIAAVAVGLALATVLRQRAFPYRRTCAECGTSLDFLTILVRDDNLCTSCRPSEAE